MTTIHELIERSSLGNSGAQALRRRTPHEVLEQIDQRVRQLARKIASGGSDRAVATPTVEQAPSD